MLVGMISICAPNWLVTTMAAFSMVATKLVGVSATMANYSGSTVWMLLAVMGFAGCLAKSGLMIRIAFNVLKIFPPSYTGPAAGN